MKKFPPILLLLSIVFLTSATWRTDFTQAKADAAKQNKHILLKFSGSDWCIPCIKMEKKVFDKEVFEIYAKDKLILINADFPRLKKNRLPKDVIKANEALAEQYNKSGHFPYTVLIDANGKVVETWDGYKDAAPEEFVSQIKNAIE